MRGVRRGMPEGIHRLEVQRQQHADPREQDQSEQEHQPGPGPQGRNVRREGLGRGCRIASDRTSSGPARGGLTGLG
jgi:hypothetical protein